MARASGIDPQPAASAPAAPAPGTTWDEVVEVASRIAAAMESVVQGKSEVVRTAITVLLAEGHLLIEDVPGVGKTLLAKALARSIDCSVKRIQFTPDLMPSDITGVAVFNQDARSFEFRPGAVFANVVVGDEINRASPKTQSALLECMEERHVTVDGTTYPLHRPFLVMATQNPIEMEGTYPLPEAQRDRFMARIAMGYPSPAAEVDLLERHGGRSPLDGLRPVTDAATVARLVLAIRGVYASEQVRQYVVDLATATRTSSLLRLGASPRAALHVLRAARARAVLDGRQRVLPDDVQDVLAPVLEHRLILTAEAQLKGWTARDAVDEAVRSIPAR